MKYISQSFSFWKQGLLFFMCCVGAFTLTENTFGNTPSADIVFLNCSTGHCTEIDSSTLSKKFSVGESIPLKIQIFNPQKKSIYSVQSWIKFDPQVFSVERLSDDNSEFSLSAPGEFKAFHDKGEIRIGRAVAGSAVNSERIVIADIVLKVKKNPNGSVLSFMEFLGNDIGKTSVVGIEDNIPFNILSQEPSPLRFENLSSAPHIYQSPSTLPDANTNGINIPGIQTQSPSITPSLAPSSSEYTKNTQTLSQTYTTLPRPQGLRTRTYTDSSVKHLWKMGTEKEIAGYYLYYSTNSGLYMHRKDIGKTNTYTFPRDFFDRGKKLYFAVQAYTITGSVSDFSDETFVVIGKEGSESHPFFEQIHPDAKVSHQDTTSTYYTSDITSSKTSPIASSSPLPTPKTSPQSGGVFSSLPFIFLGLFLLLFAYFILHKRTQY